MAETWKPDVCIYHANCADGFAAAWAVWKRFGDDVAYIPASYGDPIPAEQVAGKRVLIVDFSYKRAVLEELAGLADQIIILDHHKTAEADLADVGKLVDFSYKNVSRGFRHPSPGALRNVLAWFDVAQSGCVLAWHFCNPGIPPLKLLLYVQDRDLWQFRMQWSREVAAYVSLMPFGFATWSGISQSAQSPNGLDRIIASGELLLRKHDKDVAELLRLTTREMVIGGHRVPIANMPYTMASDAGNILAKGNPFGGTYFDRADGSRTFSLRSSADGIDVSEIATRYGGGGHRNAAGFQMPAGWEGDAS